MTRGIVLTNGIPSEGLVYHMALIFENAYHSVREFKLMPISYQHVKYRAVHARQFEERAPVKKEVPFIDTLLYGEMLEWDEFDANGKPFEIIKNYRRAPQTFKSRIFEGETQLLLMGMMSKNREVLWMLDIWPDLEIPHRLRQCSHPNVVVEAWVTLQMLPNQSLKFEFNSFASTADSFQHLCKNAVWNEGDDGNLISFYDPYSNESHDQNLVPPISCTLTGMQGIVVSKKIVVPIDPKHKDICFHRVVLNESDVFPSIGSRVKFNAEKLDYLNIYAITNVSPSCTEKPMPVTSDEQIKVAIRMDETLPGFYFTSALGIYLDDPENVLESWLLSSYAQSTLQVSMTAGEPSDKGTPRYVVTGITDAKKKKVEILREEGKIQLEGERALVIDSFGKLHFPRLPRCSIRLPRELISKYAPGTVLRVDAVLEKRWKLKSAELDHKMKPVRAVTKEDPKTRQLMTLFLIPEARGCKQLPFFLKSEFFGLLHTPRSFKIQRIPDQLVYRNVWVTINDCHPGDVLLPPAKFKFVAIGEEVEDSQPVASSTTPEFSEEEQLPEQRPEYALNQFAIPQVYPAVKDEEVEENMKVKGVSVVQMIRKLQESPEFAKNPLQAVNREIERHMDSCRTCQDRKFSDECYFAEYLANALRLKPEIADELRKKHLLSFVACRRFKK